MYVVRITRPLLVPGCVIEVVVIVVVVVVVVVAVVIIYYVIQCATSSISVCIICTLVADMNVLILINIHLIMYISLYTHNNSRLEQWVAVTSAHIRRHCVTGVAGRVGRCGGKAIVKQSMPAF